MIAGRESILLYLSFILLQMEQFLLDFTMCQDALATAWWQIGVGSIMNLKVSKMKLVSSLLLIQPFVVHIMIS
jgi:hypothetical protein